MIKRPITELHFVSSRDPKPTVEVQTDSVQALGLTFHEIVTSALSAFAKKNPTCKATIYLYGTMSFNFSTPGWSEFLIVAGSDQVLMAIGNAFSAIKKVESRFSEYLPPNTGLRAFHIEDGLLWQPDDAATWFVESNDDVETDDEVRRHLAKDSVLETDDCDLPKDTRQVERQLEEATRYRSARSDARISSIQRSIEEVFGLPEGSVVLQGPDRRALRGDAFVRTLRRRWENAS